jgi:hypothetical protein
MLIVLIVILSLLIVGLIYTNKNKEHLAVKASGVNSCGDIVDGPFGKPINSSSCFFYDITPQNENIYNSLNYVSNRVGEELNSTQIINEKLITKSREANEKIQKLMSSDIVSRVKTDLTGNDDKLKGGYIDLSNILDYYIMPNNLEEDIITRLTKAINDKIDELTNYSGVNITKQVQDSLTEDRLTSIINEISILLNNKFEARGNIDIIETINQVINGLNIDQEIKNKIKLNIMGDKQINAYLRGNSKNEAQIDDMVYYRHTLTKEFPGLGKAGDEIIVGGLVCSSADSDSRNISIRAVYFINPTKVINPQVDGPAKYQQLYIEADPKKLDEVEKQCYGMPNRNLACRPNLWLDDELAKKNLGSFTKQEVSCQNTPDLYSDLPKVIPVATVSKNLNKLLLKCKTDELKASDKKLLNMDNSSNNCEDFCINIVNDNNKPNRFLELVSGSNKTKFYFKDSEIKKESVGNQISSMSLPDGDKPRYLFQRKNIKTSLFAYSQRNIWYKLTNSGFQVPTAEDDQDPDENNCCISRS